MLCLAVMPAKAAEKDELASALRLLDQAQASFERARVSAVQAETPAERGRYFFDYSRVTHDLNTIKSGVSQYLEPSRAQPRDAGSVVGQYRRERP
ncbi:RAQPRD family integrative conjugative element protein [Salmonella enterica]|uniref:integrative conjugative element protein, RAQPRD family n=1 Tax=Salmonella enterica TaxID=28901 RepID=UPI0020CA9CA6|nr:RAQPRD family integrative conjugative element protein [Salmonella enterica]